MEHMRMQREASHLGVRDDAAPSGSVACPVWLDPQPGRGARMANESDQRFNRRGRADRRRRQLSSFASDGRRGHLSADATPVLRGGLWYQVFTQTTDAEVGRPLY